MSCRPLAGRCKQLPAFLLHVGEPGDLHHCCFAGSLRGGQNMERKTQMRSGVVLFEDKNHRCVVFNDLVPGDDGVQANQFLVID